MTLMDPEAVKDLEIVLEESEQRLNNNRDNSHEVDVVKALVTLINKQTANASVGDIAHIANIGKEQWETLKARRVGNILDSLNISRFKGGPNGNRMVSVTSNKKQILSQAVHYDIPVDTIVSEESFLDNTFDTLEHTGQSGHTDEFIPKEDNPFENDL